MIGNSIIMELIADGVQWHYLSYDHKAARKMNEQLFTSASTMSHDWIPDELKQQFPLWRTGKLRSVVFDPDGLIAKMFIGRNHKYAKRFFPSEVGDSVKPILNINNDKYGLIPAGLAVEESQLEV